MANAEALSRAWTDLARGGSTLTYEASAGEPGNGNVSTMEVPLILRDQKVGSIAIQGTAEWTTEERDLVEAVAAQTALAIENARLVNESQQAAVRERLASAITERVWSSSTVEAILQTAVRELGRALEASEATIELKLEGENE
jgi:GAF domain-containing protein